ncbi:MAG: hypothetical protein ACJZ44_01265 [Nitrospinales bacterium]
MRKLVTPLIADNFKSVKHHISDAAKKVGRNPDSIRLIVVSKQASSEKVLLLIKPEQDTSGKIKPRKRLLKLMRLTSQMRVGISSVTCKQTRLSISILVLN